MSDLLARFQAQTRRKADSDLIRRWEWDARYHGDKNIKIQASNAKRSATQMQKIKEQFSNLKPEHELAINAAASALRAMAEELTLLAAWAKDYQVFCAAAWKKEEDARLEALAQERWGDDQQALQFEIDLIGELATKDGQHAFASWCHSAGKYKHCQLDQISCHVDQLKKVETPRKRAALTVQQGMDRPSPNMWNGMYGPTVIGSWPDYEAYVAYRKEVARTSARIFEHIGRHS